METKTEKQCQDIKDERHQLRKEEIQEIENTIRKYKVVLGNAGAVDTFWETFNSSRCKTAMLVISVLFTLIYGYTIVKGIENEQLALIMIGIIGFWSGRGSKAKDNKVSKE